MNKETKVKIIIGASFVIFILLAVLASSFFGGKKTKDSSEEVSLRAEGKNDFTTADMMKANENKSSYENNRSSSSENISTSTVNTNKMTSTDYQDNTEVQALQKQLRENKQSENQDGTTNENVTPTPRNKKPKTPKVEPIITEVPTIESSKNPTVQEPLLKTPITKKPNSRSRNLGVKNQSVENNLIPAVIHNDQVITSGTKVKLRLTESIIVNGITIPRNSFVSGIANFSKTRMNITLTSIIIGNNIIPFSKSVYDRDGLEGINLPENMQSKDVSEAGADMSNQALGTIASSGIIGAAISSGGNLLRKKQQRQTVTLKANYKLFLK